MNFRKFSRAFLEIYFIVIHSNLSSNEGIKIKVKDLRSTTDFLKICFFAIFKKLDFS